MHDNAIHLRIFIHEVEIALGSLPAIVSIYALQIWQGNMKNKNL